jgi:hypothetical protein
VQLEQMGLAYLEFAAELPAHYRVLFHTRRARPAPTGTPAATSVAELPWSQSGADTFGDVVRGVGRCLAPGHDPFAPALMIWAGLHGYVGLREALVHFPFPDPSTYVTRLFDAHVAPLS